MSKIVCDYCGTIYDDGEKTCPICGYRKGEEPKSTKSPEAMEETMIAVEGFLSGSQEQKNDIEPEEILGEEEVNIPPIPREKKKKQKKEKPQAPEKQPEKKAKKEKKEKAPKEEKPAKAEKPEKPKKKESHWERKLCVVLGILVVLMGGYIAYQFAAPYLPENTTSTETTLESLPGGSCTALSVEPKVLLNQAGQTKALNIRWEPADTVDEMQFVSDNPEVIKVSEHGIVEAVRQGTANITVTCGTKTAVCEVTCDYTAEIPDPTIRPVEPTVHTNESTEATTEDTEATTEATQEETEETEETADLSGMSLNREDISFFGSGEGVYLKLKGAPEKASISWTSDDPDIASVDSDGWVEAISGGQTTVRASYKGEEWSCIVRCSFEDDSEETQPEAEEETQSPYTGNLSISHTDVTLTVGDSFMLRLRDENDEILTVLWNIDDTDVCVSNGNEITAVGSGTTEISFTAYDGETYTCVVRVD